MNPGPNLEKPNFEPFQTQVRLPKLNYELTWTLQGGKHHQDKTNDVVDVYHKFSCSESITNRMILLVVYHNLAVSEPICYPKRETS